MKDDRLVINKILDKQNGYLSVSNDDYPMVLLLNQGLGIILMDYHLIDIK